MDSLLNRQRAAVIADMLTLKSQNLSGSHAREYGELCAWVAAGKPKQVALIAVARKLLRALTKMIRAGPMDILRPPSARPEKTSFPRLLTAGGR